MLQGVGFEGILVTEITNLFAFSTVGLILGSIAQSTIDDVIWLKLGQPLEAYVGTSGEESLSEGNG
jgi:hypothetical protein